MAQGHWAGMYRDRGSGKLGRMWPHRLDQVLGCHASCSSKPACGQAQLSLRASTEGYLGSAHQKDGYPSCLTTAEH